MNKRFFAELAAGIPVIISPFVPAMVFDKFFRYLSSPDLDGSSQIVLAAITSLLIAAAIYYFSWRIRSNLGREG